MITLKAGNYELDLSSRTYIMGILNVTPDSFSDGGQFFDKDAAIRRALEMVEQGADIIDIGGESTRPESEPLILEEELERVMTVIGAIVSKINVPVSIDTYKSEVARQALDAGATIVNDISALRFDPKMVKLVAERGVPVILMHMLGEPRTMQENPVYKDVLSEIAVFLTERAEFAVQNGVARNKIIIDPGVGFGKTLEHNLETIRRLPELKDLGFPIMIGPSRKRFIGHVLDLPVEERLEGTAAAVCYSIVQGANIVRVHDVKEMVRVARMIDALIRGM